MIFIENNKDLKINTKHKFVGPSERILILKDKKEVELLCGYNVDLIICLFKRDIEIEKILLSCIMDGSYKKGEIKYL